MRQSKTIVIRPIQTSSRRDFVKLTAAGAGALLGPDAARAVVRPSLTTRTAQAESSIPLMSVPMPTRGEWQALDDTIRSWWSKDLISADEEAIRAEKEKQTLFLPHPYLRISPGPKGTYHRQFAYDAAFMNYA